MWRQLWESNPGHPLTTVGMKTQVENFKKWKNSLVYFSIDYLVWGVDQTRLMLFTLGFKAKKSIKEGQIVTLLLTDIISRRQSILTQKWLFNIIYNFTVHVSSCYYLYHGHSFHLVRFNTSSLPGYPVFQFNPSLPRVSDESFFLKTSKHHYTGKWWKADLYFTWGIKLD